MLPTRVQLILISVLSSCNAYNILCLLPYPGKSHHMVFEPLLKELVHKGHNLTVVSFFPDKNPPQNRRDVSLVGLAPIFVNFLDLNEFETSFFGLERYYEHVPLVMHLAKSTLAICDKLLNASQFDEFVQAKGDYDLVLVEHFNSDCMLGIIHKYGTPSIGLMSHAILPWTPARHGAPDNPAFVPGMTVGLTEEMTLMERVENALVLYFYKIWFHFEIRQQEQALLERKLGPLPPLEEVAKNTSALLINTHHSLNGAKAFVPAMVEVGGLHLHNRSVRPLPPSLEKFLIEADDGVILFSFGSLIRGSSLPRHRLEAFIKVFARLRQRVIWKWENDDLEGLPDNVLVIKWLPQYDILNHRKCVAFITHGGLLSMTEAVSAGVPMLVIPVLGDQFGNAAHAKRAGLVEVLNYRDIEEKALYEALSAVLTAERRLAARRVSAEWHDRLTSPMETAVFNVERAIRSHRRDGPSLASHARHLSFYQLALLDVLGVLAIVLIVFILLAYFMIKMVMKILLKNIVVKQKVS